MTDASPGTVRNVGVAWHMCHPPRWAALRGGYLDVGPGTRRLGTRQRPTPESASFMTRFLFFRSRRRVPARDWWAYFGSFGDDFFSDDLDAPGPVSC